MFSGDLGGVFGLTFGASILTVIELFEFGLGLVFSFACCLNCQRKTCQKFNLQKHSAGEKNEKEIATITVKEKSLEESKNINLITVDDSLLY